MEKSNILDYLAIYGTIILIISLLYTLKIDTFFIETLMKKQSLFLVLVGLIVLSSQTNCMEKAPSTLARSAVAAFARNPYQRPNAQQADPHKLRRPAPQEKLRELQVEAYQLLTQHYRHAQQTNTYLPDYFFTELDKHYKQVDPNDLVLKGKFGNLRVVTKPLKKTELAPIPALEVFDEESLTSTSSGN